MSKKLLSTSEQRTASSLHRWWDAWQRLRVVKGLGRMSQEEAGKRMRMTQGAVSQYLNAQTPLGTDATLKFAKLLDVSPRRIKPDFMPRVRMEGPQLVHNDEPIDLSLDRDIVTACFEFLVGHLGEAFSKASAERKSLMFSICYEIARDENLKDMNEKTIMRLVAAASAMSATTGGQD